MPRILGMERKNRAPVRTAVEREFLEVIGVNTLDLADTINIALEKHLAEKGLIGT